MDAERMLGSLVSSFLGGMTAKGAEGKRTRSGGQQLMKAVKSGLSSPTGLLTALGLAVGAAEAYKMSSAAATNAAAPPPIPGAAATPPPIPGAAVAPPPIPGAAAAPPPIPTAPAAASPGAPAPAATPPAAGDGVAVRLIQAMIAAAHADGVLDDSERQRIQGKLGEAGLSPEEHSFLQAEMERPRPIPELVEGIDDPATRRLMYGLSVAAIETDSFEEFQYLQQLGEALGMSGDEMRQVRDQVAGTEA